MGLTSYRLLPRYTRGLEDLDWRNGRGVALAECILALALFLPPLERATGVTGRDAALLIVVHVTSFAILGGPVHRLAQEKPWAFYVQVVASLVVNVAILASFLVLSGNPESALWMGFVIYAAVLGSSQELEPSLVYLLAVVIGPLLTIPYFVTRGTGSAWDWGAPVWAAWMNALTYHGLASVSARWREKRRMLQEQIAELERRQLARELHDSVGSTLVLLGLYGDLVERHLDRPDELKRIGAELKAATKEGVHELRGVLDALAPETCDVATLGRAMSRVVERAVTAGAVPIRFDVEGDPAIEVGGPVRLALVRALQEGIANAIRHARATSIAARLEVGAGELALEVTDDGSGLDASAPAGRGLAGLRTRAAELGGRVEIASARSAGTSLRFVVPVAGTDRLGAT